MKAAWDMLRSELERLQEEQGREGRTVDIFFRDDDVDEDDEALRLLMGIFLECEVPVNLEIIPGRLTESAVTLLRQHHDQRPELFEINQHGWLHVNHETEGRKCEFGPSRGFDRQLADLDSGRKVLEKAFGRAFSRVFTPPWNRCTTDTFRALDQLGYEVLSKRRGHDDGLRGDLRGYGFREVSVSLDLCRWKGGASMKPPEEIVSELLVQMGELDLVGVMLHHKMMNAGAFDWLRHLLDELRRCPAVKFHTFQSLVKCSG